MTDWGATMLTHNQPLSCWGYRAGTGSQFQFQYRTWIRGKINGCWRIQWPPSILGDHITWSCFTAHRRRWFTGLEIRHLNVLKVFQPQKNELCQPSFSHPIFGISHQATEWNEFFRHRVQNCSLISEFCCHSYIWNLVGRSLVQQWIKLDKIVKSTLWSTAC